MELGLSRDSRVSDGLKATMAKIDFGLTYISILHGHIPSYNDESGFRLNVVGVLENVSIVSSVEHHLWDAH